MNFARAKAQQRGRRSGERDYDASPRHSYVGGWRTEWPEEFPVTVIACDGFGASQVPDHDTENMPSPPVAVALPGQELELD